MDLNYRRNKNNLKREAKHAWRYYWNLYRRERGRLALATVSAIGQSVTLLPVPLLIGYLLDKAIRRDNLRAVIIAGVALLSAHLVYSGLVLLTRRLLNRADTNAMSVLRGHLVDHLFKISRRRYTELDHSRTHTAVVNDTERVAAVSAAVMDLIPAIITAIALVAMMMWVYAWLSIITLVCAPLLYWLLHLIARKVQRQTRTFRLTFENFSRGIARLLHDMTLIEYSGAENYERRIQMRQIEGLRSATSALQSVVINHSVMHTLLTGVSGALVLVVGGVGIINGQITPGQLLTVYAGFSLLRNQWLAVSRAFPMIIAGRESLLGLWEILRQPYPPPYHGRRKLSLRGGIQLKDVAFRYTDEPLLQGVSFDLEPGARAALIGESGAGKSTLINLILGFYKPDKGRILIDGCELSELDLSHLRQQIGVVPQDPIILPGSIVENIGYGLAEISQTEIENAARLSGLHEFVSHLPRAYETEVGEEGILLSGGQRQRLALARALVRRPNFLILDEPTNHLDPEALQRLVESLQALELRPTMLIISHNMDILKTVELVHTLRNGKIIASRSDRLVEPSHRRLEGRSFEVV